MVKRTILLLILPLLVSCQQQAEEPSAERIVLADAKRSAAAESAPDTEEANWSVAASGRALHFGNRGGDPLMTLDCRLGSTGAEAEPQMAVIRHAPAYPEQKALFAVIGNRVLARFLTDAKYADGEWRWEAVLPADDRFFDVFKGPLPIEATLPGHGMLEIDGSPMLGEFVEWCREGGRAAGTGEDGADEA